MHPSGFDGIEPGTLDLLGAAFGGVLVTDFYGGSNDTPGGQHQRCGVHLLRDLRALADAHAQDEPPQDEPPQGQEVRTWVVAVRTVWQQIRIARASPASDPTQREARYQALLRDVQVLGAQFVEHLSHPCRALAWRLWHFQGELLTGVRHPAVPPDNNAAERALRPLVVARKISGGTRSPRGSHTRMALATLAATWSASDLQPLHEFRRLLQTPLPQI
jgi:transposase